MNNEITATTRPALIDRVGEKVEGKLRPIFRRIPPRISLLTGGMFVLVTLYLPLAINSCCDYSGRGIDIVTRKEDAFWPSYTTFLLDASSVGRGFYLFLLGWAALAILLTFLSPRRARALGRGALLQPFSVVACAVSLILLADYFVFSLGFLDPIARWVTGKSDFAEGWLYSGIFLLAAASCLRSKAVRQDVAAALPFAMACAALVSIAALEAMGKFGEPVVDFDDSEAWLAAVTIFAGFFLGPLILWLRQGSRCGSGNASQWSHTRRRLALAFVPVVAGHFIAAFAAIESHVWGLIPCLAGVHLITLGYLRLMQGSDGARGLALGNS